MFWIDEARGRRWGNIEKSSYFSLFCFTAWWVHKGGSLGVDKEARENSVQRKKCHRKRIFKEKEIHSLKFLAWKRHFSHRYNLHRSVNEQINWEGKEENNAVARTRWAGGRSASCCDRQEREKMCWEWIFTLQFNIYWAPIRCQALCWILGIQKPLW